MNQTTFQDLCRLLLKCILPILALSGCQTVGYYSQAAWGHAQIVLSQRSIDKLLNDPNTPLDLRERLSYVMELRDFAESRLFLPVGENYLAYADIGRTYAVWNVSATPELSLEPLTWCYPIVGCVVYRGYFDQHAAESYADNLRHERYDAIVWGATAYSTLGWFDDALLSTYLRLNDAQLAALIFHELAHRLLYIPGDSAFNESFATAVEEMGLHRWAAMRNEPGLYSQYLLLRRLREEFYSIVSLSIHDLQTLYSSELQVSEKRARKDLIFSKLQRDVERLKHGQPELSRYDRWFASGLNNAAISTVSTYNQLVPAFEQLLRQSNGALPIFYEHCKNLAQMPFKERHEALHRLMMPLY